LVCLNSLYKSLMEMDIFCKLYVEIDFASLHHVTFIELLAIMPTVSLAFSLEQFMNNSIDKLIEGKIYNHFLLLEEHFFVVVLLHNKTYEVQFEDISYQVIKFSEP
jgi:hypothetical protein